MTGTDLLSEVAAYYSTKLAEHGETPRGVDWNGEEGQRLRFEQLTKVITKDGGFSLCDLGCGYGALLNFMREGYHDFEYLGCDVSSDMVNAARRRHERVSNASFAIAAAPGTVTDYCIASGIFNVRLERSDREWLDYLRRTLDAVSCHSRIGFAFNCLTSWSDADKQRAYLYYADPCEIFDLCKQRYGRNVALLHDYDLYEFTVIVRNQP